MTNLSKYIKNRGPSLILAISLDGYRRTVISDLNVETDKLVQDTIRKSTEINNKLTDKLEQTMMENVEIQAKLGRVKESLESIENNAKILNNLSKNKDNNDTLINESSNTLKESATKANELIDKIFEIINNSDSNSSNNYIQNIFDNINKILSTFDTIQLGAIGHISACISILLCIWHIFTLYYGEQLIIYFDLEKKWPKLAKFIQLRRKFLYFNIKINILIICIIVLYVLFVNVYILYYTLK